MGLIADFRIQDSKGICLGCLLYADCSLPIVVHRSGQTRTPQNGGNRALTTHRTQTNDGNMVGNHS